MGFTIDDALREFKKNYKMTLLAGEDGCSNAMTWVQMVEDKTILQQLWGKELVVTTGLGFQSQKKLKEFIEQLVKYHSVGLVINTGKYVFDIDQEIIDYCNDLAANEKLEVFEFGKNNDLVLHIYKDEEYDASKDKDYSNLVNISTAKDGKWVDDTGDIYVTDGSLCRELERINSYEKFSTL